MAVVQPSKYFLYLYSRFLPAAVEVASACVQALAGRCPVQGILAVFEVGSAPHCRSVSPKHKIMVLGTLDASFNPKFMVRAGMALAALTKLETLPTLGELGVHWEPAYGAELGLY